MNTTPASTPGNSRSDSTRITAGQRAARQVAEYRRLFEERREEEAGPGGTRGDLNFREMSELAPIVQRHMELVGRSWLTATADERHPLALVYVLAFGDRAEYEAVAEPALAQLRDVEDTYRDGRIKMPSERRRHSRSRWRHAWAHRRVKIALLVVIAFALYAGILASCGSWGPGPHPGPDALSWTARAQVF